MSGGMQLPREMRNACRVWSEKLKGRYHSEDLDIGERTLKVNVNETVCKGVLVLLFQIQADPDTC
jgi:hypothetical protein